MAHIFLHPSAVVAMTHISILLEKRVTRKHVIDALVGTWKPAYDEWLTEFVNRLSDKACVHLLIEPKLKDTDGLADRQMRQAAEKAMIDERRPGIIKAAAEVKKLSTLYALSQWSECRAAGNRVERNKMVGIDFEI